mmetsp:Transcript_135929/g.378843  ORF Transcript_135929/g.378843 Transcript_135929/m.378843 type:complete len:339 (-) Transcript_135929:154-1170(-)
MTVDALDSVHGAPSAPFADLLRPESALLYAVITEEDGHQDMLTYFGCWTLFWVLLFYCLSWTEPRWAGRWPPSTKLHENDRYWSARNVLGIIHAIFITALTVPALFKLYDAPDEVRFGATGHLAACAPGSEHRIEIVEKWGFVAQAVALAGLAFTAFTLADVGISTVHGLATMDHIAHHLAFVTAGLIIRGHCMLPFNASILLAMEASTPFLNIMLFFRHRGMAFKTAVQVNGILFVLLYVVFRVALNTYGAVVLWLHYKTAMPPTVPAWQAWFLLMAISAGAAIQFFWFPQIARMFRAGLLGLLGRGCAEDGAAEGYPRNPRHGDSLPLTNESSLLT